MLIKLPIAVSAFCAVIVIITYRLMPTMAEVAPEWLALIGAASVGLAVFGWHYLDSKTSIMDDKPSSYFNKSH